MKQRTLTLKAAFDEGKRELEAAGIEESALDAWLLLEHVTGISKASYYGNPEKIVDEDMAHSYFQGIEKRKSRIPLQHITGEQEFMGYVFKVNEHVLIPRQDTETLVEEALKVLKPGMDILDMCTGSGCIILSLMKMALERKHITGLKGTGADVSEKALETARENAQLLGMETRFIRGNLFEHVSEKYDVIVSNPPYIRTAVIDGLQTEVRLHDPMIALDGKDDGLHYYRRIVKESIQYIKTPGRLMFEIGFDQGESVKKLMEEAGYHDVHIIKDLAGLDRVVAGLYDRK